MARLLVRPRPVRDESTAGYLLRLSEANGFTSLLDLDLLASRENGRDAFSRVGTMLPGVSLQPLRGHVTRFRNLKIADPGGIHMKYWNGRRPRFCPACLAEKSYWRGVWDLTLMVACPLHRARLCDLCPGCNHPLSWRRAHISECDCGQSLTDMPLEDTTDTAVAVSAYLTAALTGETVGNRVHQQLNVQLLSLSDLLAVCVQLGGYASIHGAKPTKIARLDDVSVATVVANGAGKALIDWPQGYRELLRNVGRNERSEGSSVRLTARFGYFYTALYRRFGASQFDFLRREFEEFVRSEWVGQLAERNRRLSKATRRQHAWIPITGAAKLLGIKRATVSALIEHGTLEGQTHKSPSGRTSGTVSRRSVDKFRIEKAQWSTLTEVRKTLKISRKHAHALLRSGDLRPVRGPSVDGSPVWRFSVQEVMALKAGLFNTTSGGGHNSALDGR